MSRGSVSETRRDAANRPELLRDVGGILLRALLASVAIGMGLGLCVLALAGAAPGGPM